MEVGWWKRKEEETKCGPSHRAWIHAGAPDQLGGEGGGPSLAAAAPLHPSSSPSTHPFHAPRLQIDGINLFGLLSILSIPICLPAALVMEGASPPAGSSSNRRPRASGSPPGLPLAPADCGHSKGAGCVHSKGASDL